jgi:2-keto-4-pentenoate hydratase/2-oxohepta-3-ene-1,7-dioic acid hydratase in catechol pathway
VPLATLAPELRARGVPPESCESLQGLLEDWQHAFPLLRDIVRDFQGGERFAEAGGGRVAEAGGERVAEAGGGRVAEAGGAAAAEAGAFERLPQPLPADAISLAQLRVHAPLSRPGPIYCSGANYKKHVAELIVAHQNDERTRGMSLEEKRAWAMALMDRRAESGTPFIFVKPQSAVTGPFDPIAVPDVSEKPDWELELAVIIGRRARRVSRATALDYVAGYTIANDITLREKVFRRKTDSPELGMDFVISKGAPGFLPLGPYLVPAAFVPDPQKLRLTLKLNGQVMQDEDTADMIFSVARLIEYVSAGVELQPGDVICTGSPAGNGAHYGRFIQDGDVLEASITGLGTQRNPCVLDRG